MNINLYVLDNNVCYIQVILYCKIQIIIMIAIKNNIINMFAIKNNKQHNKYLKKNIVNLMLIN